MMTYAELTREEREALYDFFCRRREENELPARVRGWLRVRFRALTGQRGYTREGYTPVGRRACQKP